MTGSWAAEVFSVAGREIAERILAARRFLAVINPLGPEKTAEAATCKGLIFVGLYGTYEYAVRSAVQAALAALKQDQLCAGEIHGELLALLLDSHWDSATMAGRARMWDKRIELLSAARTKKEAMSFPDTLFPADGSHYRARQLRTIWRVFAIEKPIVAEKRHLGRIEELVENRNAIAHGRNRADEIGRRYSEGDLADRINDTEAIANYVLSTVWAHHADGGCRGEL